MENDPHAIAECPASGYFLFAYQAEADGMLAAFIEYPDGSIRWLTTEAGVPVTVSEESTPLPFELRVDEAAPAQMPVLVALLAVGGHTSAFAEAVALRRDGTAWEEVAKRLRPHIVVVARPLYSTAHKPSPHAKKETKQ